MKIIPLGKCCTISVNLAVCGSNHERSVFEWVLSENFEDIITITKLILSGKQIQINTGEYVENDYLENTAIRTSHYLGSYRDILDRRTQRFRDYINGSESILFIRDNADTFIDKSSVLEFARIIKEYNPKCEFTFVLLSSNTYIESKDNIIRLGPFTEPKQLRNALLKLFGNDKLNFEMSRSYRPDRSLK